MTKSGMLQCFSMKRQNVVRKKISIVHSIISISILILLTASPVVEGSTNTSEERTIVLKPKPEPQRPKPFPQPHYQTILVRPRDDANTVDAPSKSLTDVVSSYWGGLVKEEDPKTTSSTKQYNKKAKNNSIFNRNQKKETHNHHKKEPESLVSHFLPTFLDGKLEHVKMKSTADSTLVLFYEYNNSTNTSELPSVVYHENGTKVSLSDVAKSGLPILVEHPPPEPIKTPLQSPKSNSTLFAAKNTTSSKNSNSSRSTSALYSFQNEKKHINPSDWESMPQAQDQMIIVSTVATMALLVGALSARRLRSRHFLSSCIENESLEDELAYDTAYTTTGSRTGGYDTFNSSSSSGGLPWRGDLEKFDV